MKQFNDIQKEFKQFYAANISKSYGGLKAVDNFSMELDSGEIVGLIGPNGAGKTTVFNLITGMETPDSGKIYFQRNFITGKAPHQISRMGIGRTFQNIRLLDYLTVLDNVKTAYHSHISYSFADAALRLPKYFSIEKEITEKSLEFLALFGMEDSAYEPAASLPYGKRRKLEIARALATEASLLLLDEPAAGLNPSETAELSGLIRKIRNEFRISIFLIEHDMNLVMNTCEKVIVLNFGKIIAHGTPVEVKNNPDVIEAYLGTGKRN